MPLVAYYPLHEDSGTTAYDVAGANDGTVNGATVGVTGLSGNTAYSFDGTDDYINISTSPPDLSKRITISAWVKHNGTNSGSYETQRIISHGDESNDNMQYSLAMSDPTTGDSFLTPKFEFHDGSSWNGVSASEIGSGSWWNITSTYNAGDARIYLNGSLDATASLSTTLPSTSAQAGICMRYYSGAGGWIEPVNGDVAEVRVYDHALTAGEVQYLYDVVAGKTSFTSPTKPV